MKVNWEKEKEELKNLIESNISYSQIGRKYGITGAAVKKAAKKLGINLPKKRKINPKETFNKGKKLKPEKFCLNCKKSIKRGKFCNNKCQHEYQRNDYIKKWKNNEVNGIAGKYGLSRKIRNYLLEKVNYKCEICGWGEINKYSNTLPLEIHHKDGDYTNNKEENLQVLCPNCHSLTDTYKNHNKIGRKDRKKYSN